MITEAREIQAAQKQTEDEQDEVRIFPFLPNNLEKTHSVLYPNCKTKNPRVNEVMIVFQNDDEGDDDKGTMVRSSGNAETAGDDDPDDGIDGTMIRNATVDSTMIRNDTGVTSMTSELGTMVINEDDEGTMKSQLVIHQPIPTRRPMFSF